MMLSVLILSCSVLVTHAPGWSHPMITTDLWNYGFMYKAIEVSDSTIHQVWANFNQNTRIGYKVYHPDGTILYPETMISHDVWSSYTTSTLVNGDSVVLFWRENVQEYYCVREHDGEEAVPTSLFVPDPWVHRPEVHASSDTLGRIHAVFETSAGTCYGIFDPVAGESWRDTLPGGNPEMAQILVDGSRVHIVFQGPDLMPDYIQYDLEGNITVPVVSLVDDLTWFNRRFQMAIDYEGDLYCFFVLSRGHIYMSLFKIDGETGNIIIYDKLIWDGDGNEEDQIILPTASGDSFYLLWRESRYGVPYHTHYIMFSLIDMNGDFIEEPYEAYDYSDEGLQNLYILRATTNDEGDIFAIWDQGDVGVGGYWIVMGWFDHNWVGIEEETTTLLEPCEFVLIPSLNPFSGSVTITVESDPLPGQLVVYDLSGHMVQTLCGFGSDSFFWDGCDSAGDELPAGTYIVQGASSGRLASVKVVKL